MKTALVTGVSRGIGEQVARALLADGWRVFGVSRTAPSIEHERFVPWAGVALGSSHVDYQVAGALERAIGDRPLDALVHCAAVQGPVEPFPEVDFEQPGWQLDEWEWCVRVNLIGTAQVVRGALAHLKRAEDARILLFSGGGAFNARINHSAYAASKAGVVSLMETLAAELWDTTVAVNCVAPGVVPTSIHQPPLPDDGGARMAEAVACVLHLLSPATRGLKGRTVSAEYDDWRSISSHTIGSVVNSVQGTRYRHPIQRVQALAGVGA